MQSLAAMEKFNCFHNSMSLKVTSIVELLALTYAVFSVCTEQVSWSLWYDGLCIIQIYEELNLLHELKSIEHFLTSSLGAMLLLKKHFCFAKLFLMLQTCSSVCLLWEKVNWLCCLSHVRFIISKKLFDLLFPLFFLVNIWFFVCSNYRNWLFHPMQVLHWANGKKFPMLRASECWNKEE